jgi:CubicO group peptidase (beta-lactamase class C family)
MTFSALVTLLLATVTRTAIVPCDSTLMPAGYSDVIRAAQQLVDKGELPSLAFAIAQKGRVVCESAIGWANRENRSPATASSIYAVGSIAKSVTALALYVLADRRQVELDESPDEYGVAIPRYAGRAISIRQLLNMTAGIPHGWLYDFAPAPGSATEAGMIGRYSAGVYPPGRIFHYSNFSFGIAGRVAEAASRQDLATFAAKELLLPLEMSASGFALPKGDVATGYEGAQPVAPHQFYPRAGGGFYTSAHDLALFGLYQLGLGPPLLSEKSLADLRTATATGGAVPYANGWAVLGFASGDTLRISNGRVLGGAGTLLLLPKQGLVIACLTNIASDATDEFAIRFGALFVPTLQQEFESARKKFEAMRDTAAIRVADLRGRWHGLVTTPEREIPVTLHVTDNSARLSLWGAAAVPVTLRVEEGLVQGEAVASIRLPEKSGATTKLELRLLPRAGERMTGSITVISPADKPGFGLPLPITLARRR